MLSTDAKLTRNTYRRCIVQLLFLIEKTNNPAILKTAITLALTFVLVSALLPAIGLDLVPTGMLFVQVIEPVTGSINASLFSPPDMPTLAPPAEVDFTLIAGAFVQISQMSTCPGDARVAYLAVTAADHDASPFGKVKGMVMLLCGFLDDHQRSPVAELAHRYETPAPCEQGVQPVQARAAGHIDVDCHLHDTILQKGEKKGTAKRTVPHWIVRQG
jgi:hypothetical protein